MVISVDAGVYGNELKFVNDPRGTDRKANVQFNSLPAFDRLGLPTVTMTTLCDIQPHQELLVNYGDRYWENVNWVKLNAAKPEEMTDEAGNALENEPQEQFPRGHEFTSRMIWDDVASDVLREVARPQKMPTVAVAWSEDTKSDTLGYVAFARQTIPEGECVGLIGGRLLADFPVDHRFEAEAVIYEVPGVKFRGIVAENEAKYFLDAANPNCKWCMDWTEHGAVCFVIWATRRIRKGENLTMCRRMLF